MSKTYYCYDNNLVYAGLIKSIIAPNNSTLVQPLPERVGYKQMFAGNKWIEVEDLDGVKGWLNGKEYTHSGLNPLPDGFSYTPPEDTLEEAKGKKTTEINNACANAITEGFWFKGAGMGQSLHFSYDNEDQINMNDAMNGVNLYLNQMATAGTSDLPSTIAWNGYTDLEHTELVTVVFQATTFVEFWGYASTGHKSVLIELARVLKEAIANATTVEEVRTIKWEVPIAKVVDEYDPMSKWV